MGDLIMRVLGASRRAQSASRALGGSGVSKRVMDASKLGV